MKTITEQLADALRRIVSDKGSAQFNHDLEAYDVAVETAREALAAYDAQQAEELTVRVNGEAARMALCGCLKGWTARRDGTWHVVTTRGNRAHMLELINDLGIRAKVQP